MSRPKRTTLTPKQRAAAEYYALHPKITQEEISKLVGVCEWTITYWKKNPLWIAYVDELLREQWKDAARVAQRQMQNMMENGDYRATEYILNSAGYGATKNVNVTTDTTITLNIEDED